MIRTAWALTVVGLVLLAGSPVSGQEVFRSAHHDFRVVTVADGLVNPWSMAWLPGGDMLIAERPGRLRIVRNGTLLPDPVAGVPEVFAQGQGGLFDVLPHQDFASNRLLYLSYARPKGDGSTTAVIRGRFDNDRLTDIEEIFEATTEGRGHYGGRLAWGLDGFLFLTVGERQVPSTGDLEAHPAQDLSNHHGVTVRLHEDGRVPADNPFVGQEGALPEIWSYGHRNPQGLAVHPETGDVWLNEHGPQGGDELNLVQPGLNYGWPVIGYGVNYRAISVSQRAPRPAQVGGFDVNIVIHGSTTRRSVGPVEADGAVDAQNAALGAAPQGLSHQIIHEKPRKVALGNP